MEKKIAIVLGIVSFFVLLMIISRGKILPFICIGVLAYGVYKSSK